VNCGRSYIGLLGDALKVLMAILYQFFLVNDIGVQQALANNQSKIALYPVTPCVLTASFEKLSVRPDIQNINNTTTAQPAK
tara:strand:+ start:84 stop:326 length:243 start_codon:yes stop_codon:yes gene_type:complete